MQNKIRQFKKIAKSIAKGNKRALKTFFEIYGKTIYSIAKTICHTHESADEVVNDVLLKIWKMAEFACTLENPEGWLRIVIVNAAKDKLKQRQCLPLTDDIQDNADTYKHIADNDQFYYMIHDLNETEQAIMIYRFVEDLTFDEIAHILDKPLSTITSTYYRALEKINKKFN